MFKKQWLVLCPIALLLGFGFTQSILAAPQSTQSAPDNSTGQNPDDGNDDFDNSQDYGQDQSSTDAASAPDQAQPDNTNTNTGIDSSDDEDED